MGMRNGDVAERGEREAEEDAKSGIREISNNVAAGGMRRSKAQRNTAIGRRRTWTLADPSASRPRRGAESENEEDNACDVKSRANKGKRGEIEEKVFHDYFSREMALVSRTEHKTTAYTSLNLPSFNSDIAAALVDLRAAGRARAHTRRREAGGERDPCEG